MSPIVPPNIPNEVQKPKDGESLAGNHIAANLTAPQKKTHFPHQLKNVLDMLSNNYEIQKNKNPTIHVISAEKAAT